MKLGNLFVVNAVIAGLFGLAFIFAPAKLLAQYGLAVDAGFGLVAQLFGAALIGYAILTWLVRKAADSEARRAIVLALFICDAVAFVLSLMAQLKGLVTSLGWSTVVIYLLLALGFAYFLFAKPSEA
jgi:phosphoglycerol transferase MdoB-like AlkP superfamily enzyme